MTDYTKIIPHILQWETGSPNGWKLVNDPNDKGGLTLSGLTYTTYKGLCRLILGVSPSIKHFENLSKSQWQLFVKYFWDKATFNGKVKSQAISEFLTDFLWGSGQAIRVVQKTLNLYFNKKLVVDGVMGPRTVSAINSIPENKLLDRLHDARISYYKSLDNHLYNDGWNNRANALYNDLKNSVTSIVYAIDEYAGKPNKVIVGFFFATLITVLIYKS